MAEVHETVMHGMPPGLQKPSNLSSNLFGTLCNSCSLVCFFVFLLCHSHVRILPGFLFHMTEHTLFIDSRIRDIEA
jgi:hypothetical protein